MDPADLGSEITDIWEVVLGVDGIGPDDHFLRLGGQSTEAMRMISWVRDRTEAPVRVADLFRHPVLRDFVRAAEARAAEARAEAPAAEGLTDPAAS